MKPLTREKALELLRTDINKWNEYRDQRGSIPDLSGADLSGADLSWANLSWANLSWANLSWANLCGANLTEANLTEANLTEADLTKADLIFTNISKADLIDANLSRANLYQANLYDADLSNADLSNADLSNANLIFTNISKTTLTKAILDGASFGNTIIGFDLSGPVGLNDADHFSLSDVSLRSLRSCGDGIPTKFLRGCGLTDLEIELIPSISGAAIKYYSCFICYSHKDKEFARRLYADLQDAGVRCWFAPEDIDIGDRPLKVIGEAIRLRDKLVLTLSDKAHKSDWVEHEVNRALDEEGERGKDILFPIRIDDAIMSVDFGWAKRLSTAHELSGRHIGNFERWKEHDAYQAAFAKLLRGLKAAPHTAP